MFKTIKPALLLLVTVSSCLICSQTGSAQQSKGESLLNKGDTIQVYVDLEDFQALKSASVGATVKIKVLDNISRFGETVIGKFQPVYCKVVERKRGGMYGGAGKMTLSIDSTHSTAKTMVPVKGMVHLKGKGGTAKKVVAYVLFPFGWLIKGSDVEFPEGKNVFKPVVSEETPVEFLR